MNTITAAGPARLETAETPARQGAKSLLQLAADKLVASGQDGVDAYALTIAQGTLLSVPVKAAVFPPPSLHAARLHQTRVKQQHSAESARVALAHAMAAEPSLDGQLTLAAYFGVQQVSATRAALKELDALVEQIGHVMVRRNKVAAALSEYEADTNGSWDISAVREEKEMLHDDRDLDQQVWVECVKLRSSLEQVAGSTEADVQRYREALNRQHQLVMNILRGI